MNGPLTRIVRGEFVYTFRGDKVVRRRKKVRSLFTPEPVGDGFPNASNTGVPGGTVLVGATGELESTAAGQVFEKLDLMNGGILIKHPNVIVRKCRLLTGYIAVIDPGAGSGALIEDCEVNVNYASNTAVYIGIANCTVRRCNLYNMENGVFVGSGSGHTVRDNYIHDAIPYDPVVDPHIDGIQFWGDGISNCLVEHNTVKLSVFHGVNSAITGGLANVNININNNIFDGGGYTMYSVGGGAVTNNRFGLHEFGYYTPNGIGNPASVTFSGNIDHFTEEPILE